MELRFSSIEEVQEFVKRLKGTRGGKGDKDEGDAIDVNKAPPPLAPPQTGAVQGFQPGGFAPQVAGAGPAAAGPFAAAAIGPAPEVLALVNRINVRLDAALMAGQPTEQALDWFRKQCGPEAAAATMEQIKTVFLAKLSVPALENIAKQMNA